MEGKAVSRPVAGRRAGANAERLASKPGVNLRSGGPTSVYPTTRPEPELTGKSLFDALPQKLVRHILPVNHSSFPVLAGDQEKAIIALKFEPSDIVDPRQFGGLASSKWWVMVCAFKSGV